MQGRSCPREARSGRGGVRPAFPAPVAALAGPRPSRVRCAIDIDLLEHPSIDGLAILTKFVKAYRYCSSETIPGYCCAIVSNHSFVEIPASGGGGQPGSIDIAFASLSGTVATANVLIENNDDHGRTTGAGKRPQASDKVKVARFRTPPTHSF